MSNRIQVTILSLHDQVHTFFLEFRVSISISCDFNLRLDVSGDVDAAKFVDLLESMCLKTRA